MFPLIITHNSQLSDLPNKPIAGFDIDHCIIKPKNNRVHPKDEHDWVFTYSNVISKLRDLAKTHKIVFITNQLNLLKKETMWRTKINNVIEQINVPVIVFAIHGHTSFRKPSPKLWMNLQATFDLDKELAARRVA